jgi:hypothetical protein
MSFKSCRMWGKASEDTIPSFMILEIKGEKKNGG